MSLSTTPTDPSTTTASSSAASPSAASTSPTDRVLTASLVAAPLMYLVTDSLYAARGWTDATAGVVHVLAAIAYAFVPLRVATWLPRESRLAAFVIVTGVVGMAGNVAYGFETIHLSLGDIQLVDQPGAANLIKPLGLVFPLSFALVAVTLARLGLRWQAAVVLVAIICWPIAHIGNIAAAAVPVNVALVVALGSLVRIRE